VWEFEKSVGAVFITGDNGKAEDLTVAGFDVSGKVLAGDQPMAGVGIVLFGSKALKKCADSSVAAVTGPAGSKQVCRTTTNSNGEFVFPVVPGGKFTVVPFYKGEHTQFEVTPGEVEINVDLDSYKLTEPFLVKGFSVKGKVLTSSQGKPMGNAEVTLTGAKTHTAKTDKDGQYFIDRIESGTYTITAGSNGIQFNELVVDISPSKPILPPIMAEKFQVSGSLDFSTVSPDTSRKVKLSSPGKPDISISVGNDGKFSTFLPAAAFSVSVIPSNTDTKMGIVFAPLALDIIVKSEPEANLYFSPVRVTIAGSVKCTSKCPDLTVQLIPEGAGEASTLAVQDGKFSFQNQLPGRYSIAVDEAGLCWEKPAIIFNIDSESKEDLEFVQTGYGIEIHSTHETSLRFKTKDEKLTGTLDIPVGPSSHCLPADAEFTLQSSGCHQFQGENKGFLRTPGQKLVLRAEKHLVSGRVSSVETIPDLQIIVHTQTEIKTMALTQPENKDGLQSYRFSYLSNPHEEITLEPVAAKFLFNPTKLHISVEDDCLLESAIFTATQGLFISGSIRPVVEGASILLSSPSLPQPVSTTTDIKGDYSMGPFPRDIDYGLQAEKIGYIISQTDKKGVFSAKKLASVVVHVLDAQGEKLSEAVVSLSGGENNFRTNQQTGANGTLSFLALSPGEYFIKPMLKEYEFTPKSKLITVKEGTEEVVEIVANRVAYSTIGVLTGLKGDPESGVVLEAVGVAEGCKGHQEEGVSAQDGKFRIRGLVPNCAYRLGLKSCKSNSHVERTIPAVKTIQVGESDVSGVELIALRPRTNMDVSLLVKVKKDNIKNVKAKLFCSSSDSPLHTVKLDTIKFVIFPSIPADGSSCSIHVEANSIHVNQRVKAQKIQFTADRPFDHYTVDLDVESSLARGEMGQASWATLPLLVLLVTAVLHWEKVSPYMASLGDQVERTVMQRRPRVSNQRSEDTEMTREDIDKAVKFVEASTRKKKVKKI
jgi:hypothetical protein